METDHRARVTELASLVGSYESPGQNVRLDFNADSNTVQFVMNIRMEITQTIVHVLYRSVTVVYI